MMKPGMTVIIVDLVDDAIKFYTERLGFDIVHLYSERDSRKILFAMIKKGKCNIIFRTPLNDEVVELSQVRHCQGRATGIFIELKKGIEKFQERCRKKHVTIASELSKKPWGYDTFTVRDPFGIKVTFAQPTPNFKPAYDRFLGMAMDKTKDSEDLMEQIVSHLKTYRITRRPAKKFAKLWVKGLKSKK